MRRVFAVCVVAAIVAACAGAGDTGTSTTRPVMRTTTTDEVVDESTTTTAPPTPQHGGTVVIGSDQEPSTLNPFTQGGNDGIVSVIGQTHLAGVYDIAATTLTLVPELVTELPSAGNGGVVVNEDGTMTVRYQIRDEAVWSDGVPITGDDLAYTASVLVDRLAADETIEEVPYEIVGTEAAGKTFTIVFATPTVAYETMFPVVMPRHAVVGSDIDEDWNDSMWPSAGPFVLAEWQKGEYLRLARNDNYWKTDSETGARLPYLDEVIFRFIPDTEALMYSFTQREVDVINPPPATEIVERLRDLESAGAEVQVKPGPVWEHLNFQFGPNNRNPESLNAYAKYRRAIAYAIDAERLAELVGWEPITSMLSPETEGGPWSQYTQNLDKARDLVGEACAEAERDCSTNPPTMVFSTTSNAEARPRIATELVEVLGEVGIEVELELEDSQVFFGETLDEGTWDAGLWAWVASPGAAGFTSLLDFVDPDGAPPDGANYYRWGTPDSSVNGDAVVRFREILASARDTVDPEQLVALARAAEEVLADDAVLIPIGSRVVVGAVWADKVSGFEMNTSAAGHTWNIEFWFRIDLQAVVG